MDLLADEAYLYVNLLRNIALWRSESVHICIGIALSDQARPSQIRSEQPLRPTFWLWADIWVLGGIALLKPESIHIYIGIAPMVWSKLICKFGWDRWNYFETFLLNYFKLCGRKSPKFASASVTN